MATIIEGFTVSCSNSSARQKGSITVKRNGVVYAKVVAERSGLLNYMRKYPLCDERAILVDQLTRNNIDKNVIDAILAMPVK